LFLVMKVIYPLVLSIEEFLWRSIKMIKRLEN